MQLNYDLRLEEMRLRRFGEDAQFSILKEAYEEKSDNPVIKYILGAMSEVQKEYTLNTYKEGERIKNQLEDSLYVEFKYQGSVTNNTHIKSYSDIDLLVITKNFNSVESAKNITSLYTGNPIEDLVDIRKMTEELLTSRFPKVNVDTTGAKSISLSGGSLRRKIDVVPANWYHTDEYYRTYEEHHKGIMILDYKNKTRLTNLPFFHNYLLEQKDIQTNYGFKKMIRLLKTLKADSDEEINLSSYDIAALMYSQPITNYMVTSSVELIHNTFRYLKVLIDDFELASSLKVPDQSRYIFEYAEKIDLLKLNLELTKLLVDLE